MSSTSSAPDTYARPRPSWPGARRTWASAVRERALKVGPSPVVEGSRLPSQSSMENGRSGSARSISVSSGAVREEVCSNTPCNLTGGVVRG